MLFCSDVGLDNFLILADKHEMYVVSLDTQNPVNVRVPLARVDTLSAVAWDSRDDTIYFADLGRHTINAVDITVSGWYNV